MILQSVSFVSGFNFEWPSALSMYLHTSTTASGGASKVLSLQCVFAVSKFDVSFVYAEMLSAILLPILFSLIFGTAIATWTWCRYTCAIDAAYHAQQHVYDMQELSRARRERTQIDVPKGPIPL